MPSEMDSVSLQTQDPQDLLTDLIFFDKLNRLGAVFPAIVGFLTVPENLLILGFEFEVQTSVDFGIRPPEQKTGSDFGQCKT